MAHRTLRDSVSSESAVRREVGSYLGFDFSGVRLHRDAADVSAEGAHAATSGSEIRFAPGRFRPDLAAGRALLAHELTHVAQQGAAPRLGMGPGRYGDALASGVLPSSDRLARSAASLADPQAGLTPAPRGMRQRCILTGCKSLEDDEESGSTQKKPEPERKPESEPATEPESETPTAKDDSWKRSLTTTPSHTVGPSATKAGNKVVRLAWTVDDGPTQFTGGMSKKLSPRASTWYIMSNQLGKGSARTTAVQQLQTRQKAGDEVAIHSFHPTVGHSAWFPINLGKSVPQGYKTTADAMADLESFTQELRGASLDVRFARMPGGEMSEVKKYIENEGGKQSEQVAQALLSDKTPPTPAPTQVETDVKLVKKTLSKLDLHLWGGSATGPEITRNSWEAESSGVPERTDDVLKRFQGVVDNLASGTRKTKASFIILAHDTTKADVDQAEHNIQEMEKHAITKGVRVEYYTTAQLYEIVRGTAP